MLCLAAIPPSSSRIVPAEAQPDRDSSLMHWPAGFATSAAVGLSNITILGGAISNLMFNAPRRHTLKEAPLIDWDLIMVMEPVTILGTILGGYLNKVQLQGPIGNAWDWLPYVPTADVPTA